MTTTYTYGLGGSVALAENERFSWHSLNHSYVHDKAVGRSLYLPAGGYALAHGFGNDPAPEDVLAAAREFAAGVHAENERIEAQRIAERQDRLSNALAVLDTIPAAARAELDQINANLRRRANATNEGGYGYVPQVGWSGQQGRDLLAKHGVSPDQIDAIAGAIAVLNA